jgi:hypothetical protein
MIGTIYQKSFQGEKDHDSLTVTVVVKKVFTKYFDWKRNR